MRLDWGGENAPWDRRLRAIATGETGEEDREETGERLLSGISIAIGAGDRIGIGRVLEPPVLMARTVGLVLATAPEGGMGFGGEVLVAAMEVKEDVMGDEPRAAFKIGL